MCQVGAQPCAARFRSPTWTAACRMPGCFAAAAAQDDNDKTDLGVLKNVMAHNWVEPSKRERKRVLNYSETEYYKQVGAAAAVQTRLPCMALGNA